MLDEATGRSESEPKARDDAGARAGVVTAVSRDTGHNFTKSTVDEIELVAGLGVKGDAHWGETVQHLVRVREDPTKPNRRQVHLIHGELHDELKQQGFTIGPGDIGENITTRGIDLLSLPLGTRLSIGHDAVVEVTGLRTPCKQIERYRSGLLAAVSQDANGNLFFKSGIMGIVLKGGVVKAGDAIRVELPPEPHQKLGKV
jgi:MOSC domain-containing protein YiiM